MAVAKTLFKGRTRAVSNFIATIPISFSRSNVRESFKLLFLNTVNKRNKRELKEREKQTKQITTITTTTIKLPWLFSPIIPKRRVHFHYFFDIFVAFFVIF